MSGISRLGLAALAGIIAFAIITGGGRETRRGQSVKEMADDLAISLGFGIAQVEISGNKFTTDIAINDTLDLANVRSLLRLDSAAVRQRIERLPWIEKASVARVFPDQIRINVTERKPFARWQRGERLYIVDRTGRVLTAIQSGISDDLPLVAGEGAAEAAAPLLALLDRQPGLAGRVLSAERIDGRRWSLHLADGPVVLLPSDGEAQALDRLVKDGVLKRVAAMSATLIDLRLADRVIIGRGEAEAAVMEDLRARVPQPERKPAQPAVLKEKTGA